VINALAKQLSGSVKWRDNMSCIISKTHNILELGPNRPLRGFFKTVGVDILSVINMRSATKVFA
jgi:malonyl CoA-acyl carrier protein transacylase